MAKLSVFLFTFSLALFQCKSENHEKASVNYNHVSTASPDNSGAATRMGRRRGRSINEATNEFSTTLNIKADTSDSSESDKRHFRQRRESMIEKWANKGAGYIEQGTAGAAVLTQLGSSAVEMGANEAASAFGEAASDGGQKVSEGTFQAGTAMADMLKKGASMLPFGIKS